MADVSLKMKPGVLLDAVKMLPKLLLRRSFSQPPQEQFWQFWVSVGGVLRESWGVLGAALTPDASFWLPWTALVLSWVTSE